MKNDRDAHDEPGRLLDGSDPQAPQELLRALRALRQEQPSPAMLERLVERVANAPLTAESSAAGTLVKGAAVGKWLAGSGLLVVVGTVASLAWPSASAPRTPEPVAPASAVSAAPPSKPLSEEVAAPTPEAARPLAGVAQPAPSSRAVEAQLPAKAAGPRSARRARRDQAARLERAPSPAASASHQTLRAAEPAAPKSAGEETDAPAATREQAPKPATHEASALREESARVAVPSEAELLVRARSLRISDPEAALALLDQHARRFGDGLLAIEREVLTIETLRKLGRQDEAARRLAAFRARYPSSPHTRRLGDR
jgi:hypothetical protein